MINSENGTAPHFPFSAIVGQDPMKRALVFNAIDSSIGGVLISGTRGTAKSTAARAIATLLPKIKVLAGDPFNTAPPADQTENIELIPTPFVNLPVGATEDRVLGTLDVEHVLHTGVKHFEPGLLAQANRGVLYVDEVNLLPDHLVDVLLDAVAMGINCVEREGVSITHEARVILVGTMNPEEGELRPQLLDRFGLSVSVIGYFEPDLRKEVIRRRIAFDSDPIAYSKQWQQEEKTLSNRILHAMQTLNHVNVADEHLEAIVEACSVAHADGLRADIVAYKTARAIAAFDGRSQVNEDDVKEALSLALLHRRRSGGQNRNSSGNPQTPPSSQSENDPQRNPKQAQEQESKQLPVTVQHFQQDESNNEEPKTPQMVFSNDKEQLFSIGDGFDASKMIPYRFYQDQRSLVFGKGTFGAASGRGQFVRAVLPRAKEKLDPAIEATIRAAAIELCSRNPEDSIRLVIRPEHWRHKQRKIRTRNLILFVVDASGSMAAQQRMQSAKGAICSLLEQSYQKRNVVSMLAFRGERAEEILPPTRSAVFAYRRLAQLPAGGRTPLAEGLKQTRRVIERQARKGERVRPFLVLVTDGRATFPESQAFEIAISEAIQLRKMGILALCIDMETGPVRFHQTRSLAQNLNATYKHISDLPPKHWGPVIEEWVKAGQGLFV
ncbi:magnesium chelatase subunit D family protein [bacterium]|nr:magnesium chelatase subunit D family protein [bacterium]